MFFLKKRLSRRPHSDQDVAMELLWRSNAFLQSFCWRFYALSRHYHCTFTALTLRALRCHGILTACSRCLHCADGVTSQKSIQISGTGAFRIYIHPSKPKTGNYYMCNIKNSQNTREHIVNRVSSHFLKKVATQQLNLN